MFHFNLMYPENGRTFKATYKCFSVSMMPGNERQDVENGGKIIMPPSALDSLTRLNVEYPMLFKLTNGKKNRCSHAGVLEFVAGEGKCYLPYWMMDNLLLGEAEIITVESVSLPVATFSKFQPHSTDFLDITNPKAVLENALRNFACLTKSDVVAIKYNKKVYELCVLETRPGNAVSIIECDMNVEFEAPVGYKEPTRIDDDEPMEEVRNTIVEEVVDSFKGSGIRLDGKQKKDNQMEGPIIKKVVPRGVPDHSYRFGLLQFDRTVKAISDRLAKIASQESPVDTFAGHGFSMKKIQK